MGDERDATPTELLPADRQRTMLDPGAAGRPARTLLDLPVAGSAPLVTPTDVARSGPEPGRRRTVRRRLVFALGLGVAAAAAGVVGGVSLVGSRVPTPAGPSVTLVGPSSSADSPGPPAGTSGPAPSGPTGTPQVDEDEQESERERREKEREQREKVREERERDRERQEKERAERDRERAEEESQQR